MRIRSEEAARVARWFGLESEIATRSELLTRKRGSTALTTGKRAAGIGRDARVDLQLAPGTITLITGASGAGKSSLLRELRSIHHKKRQWVDLMSIRPAAVPVVNCFDDPDLEGVLALLGRVGLGEAWTYLRTPRELSEGQRFRLKLAMGIHTMRQDEQVILACDEFCATLDRVTAMIVSRCLRKAIDAKAQATAAVVCTSHDDLVRALAPDVEVKCDFGRVSVEAGAI